MATWTSFYVKTNDISRLTDCLQLALPRLTESVPGQSGKIANEIQPTTNGEPDRILVSQTSLEWATVFHNSYDKLEDLCLGISDDMQTSVVVTVAQTVSSYYYFAYYLQGSLKREIEVCYSDDTEILNTGEKLPFETGSIIKEPEDLDEDIFDADSLERYCKGFGFAMFNDPLMFRWTLLQAPAYNRVVKTLTINKTPWWKFW